MVLATHTMSVLTAEEVGQIVAAADAQFAR